MKKFKNIWVNLMIHMMKKFVADTIRTVPGGFDKNKFGFQEKSGTENTIV